MQVIQKLLGQASPNARNSLKVLRVLVVARDQERAKLGRALALAQPGAAHGQIEAIACPVQIVLFQLEPLGRPLRLVHRAERLEHEPFAPRRHRLVHHFAQHQTRLVNRERRSTRERKGSAALGQLNSIVRDKTLAQPHKALIIGQVDERRAVQKQYVVAHKAQKKRVALLVFLARQGLKARQATIKVP